LIQTYKKPWLFPQAVQLVKRVVETKVTSEKRVDPRELCNLRYVTLLTERISEALRPAEGGAGGLLPVLDEYEPIGSTDSIAFNTTRDCEPTTKSHVSRNTARTRGADRAHYTVPCLTWASRSNRPW
jgi:hypothetical protein